MHFFPLPSLGKNDFIRLMNPKGPPKTRYSGVMGMRGPEVKSMNILSVKCILSIKGLDIKPRPPALVPRRPSSPLVVHPAADVIIGGQSATSPDIPRTLLMSALQHRISPVLH